MKRSGFVRPMLVPLSILGLVVALLAGGDGNVAAGQTPAKRLDVAGLEKLMNDLGLDATQKAKLRDMHADYDMQISLTAAKIGIWSAYHEQDLILQKMLTEQQSHNQAKALSAMRLKDLHAMAKTLGLTEDQRLRIAKLRDMYEPKFLELVTPTQHGEKMSQEERQSTHKKVLAMRVDFLKAVRAELTETQRAQLPGVLSSFPGLPSYIPEGDGLAYVLLAATLAHYSQPPYLETLATTLDLNANQKEQFRKVGDSLGSILKTARADFAAASNKLAQQEREAMANVLTEEQRKQWAELRKAKR